MSTVRRWRRATLVAVTVLLGACGGGGGGGSNSPPPPPPPPSGSLQFQAGSLAVDENAGTASVTITRMEGTDGAVSVTVASKDGSATAAQDYTSLSTTVNFAAGDAAAKTVTLLISDDTAGEADETFTLTLSAASGGATLGAITTATITIRDNDPPSAPLLNVGATVKQLTFNWASVPGATSYRLFQDPNGTSAFTQVGADHAAAATSAALDVVVHRHDWVHARYRLDACNARGCTPSTEISALNAMLQAIGYFKASNTESDDAFGSAVALSADGNTLAVSAVLEDSNATGIGSNQADNTASESGAVYMFARSAGGQWAQQAYLKASNADATDRFGRSVALSANGDTLVVGADGESSSSREINGNAADNSASASGAAYVFVRSAGAWTQQAYLKASNADKTDHFGWSVVLSADGHTVAVGAIGEASLDNGVGGDGIDNQALNAGAVYVFVRSGTAWTQQAYVKATNPQAEDLFGLSLALSGDGNTLAVGTPNEDSLTDPPGDSGGDVGAVYVFVRSNDTWTFQRYVKAFNRENSDFFGRSVALSFNGNILAVGAPGEDSHDTGIDGNFGSNDALQSGAVYVFGRSSSGVWNVISPVYVKASNTEANDLFGSSVAFSADGTTLAVGALAEASSASGINGDQDNDLAAAAGAVYVFAFDDSFGTWAQRAYVKAPNPGGSDGITVDGDAFGSSLALSADGSTLAVGVESEDGNGRGIGGNQDDNSAPDAGAVYLY